MALGEEAPGQTSGMDESYRKPALASACRTGGLWASSGVRKPTRSCAANQEPQLISPQGSALGSQLLSSVAPPQPGANWPAAAKNLLLQPCCCSSWQEQTGVAWPHLQRDAAGLVQEVLRAKHLRSQRVRPAWEGLRELHMRGGVDGQLQGAMGKRRG